MADQSGNGMWNGSPADVTVEVKDGLLVIKNTKEQDNVYSLQLHIGSGITTEKGHDYRVKIDYKVVIDGASPSSGVWIGLGSWAGSRPTDYGKSLSASDDFQTLTCEFNDFYQSATDNFVMWQSGKLIGTIYIKKVEVIEVGSDVAYISEVEKYEAPTGTTDIKDLTGSNTGWAETVVYPKTLAVQGQAFGDGNGSNEGTHVNIEGYDYICFDVTTATENTAGLRVWIWDGEAGGAGSVVTLYAKPIADYEAVDAAGTWTTASKITGVGTYVVKVSGYKYLKGVKAANDYGSSAAVVSMAYMCTGAPVAYVPTGETTVSGTEYLSYKNITCFDATGLIDEGQTLDAANSNALFIAEDGMLDNIKNVIVGDVCANLVLTDGDYPFKAPVDFDAEKVSYNRTFTVGWASTVCLPFELDEDEVEAAGTFYELTGYSEGTLTFTKVEETEAYKPYLFMAAKANPFSSYYSDKAIGETPADLSVTVGDATMTGTMSRQSVKGCYGWNSADGVFSKATSYDVTIDPFRAYITISGESLARVATLFIDNTVTGINEVSNSEDIKGVKKFEGKVFENGRIVIFKKGMKFNAAGAQVK